MPKDDHVEVEGEIIDALGGGQYKIMTKGENPAALRAKLSGRMKKNRIRVLPGDTVRVSVSPYDMTHGMIIFRKKF